MSSSSSSSNEIRVTTYNVLSPNLARPDYYSSYNPKHIDPEIRLSKVISKLSNEISNQSIICLQEVAHDWVGPLYTFFAKSNYVFLTGLYGRSFNGYMGIGIALPLDVYELEFSDVHTLSDVRADRWPRAPSVELTFMKSLVLKSTAWIGMGLSLLAKPWRLLVPAPKPPIDHWTYSENRKNILVFCQLRHKSTQQTFCVGNYHMPCAFRTPMVMTIHAEMAMHRVQTLSKSLPYIFCGDFNILPDSSQYKLLTTASIDESDEVNYPTAKYDTEFKVNIKASDSAYFSYHNKEPEFTNHAQVKEDDPFIGTLDYIFLSKDDWSVLNVKELPSLTTPFPNDIEPSDHLLLSASLKLN